MRYRVCFFLSVLLVASAWLGATAQPQADAQAKQQFDKNVAPLFARHCLDCHSGPKPRGGLDLASHAAALTGGKSGKAIVPGNAQASLLWKHVESGKMPPKKPLSADEKQ